MDLIVYQMVELEVMHVTNGNRRIEVLTGTSVTKLNLTIRTNRNTFPELSVVIIIMQIIHNLRSDRVLILLLELIPIGIDVIVSHNKKVMDIFLVCTIEYRSLNIETKYLGCKGQMNLEDLSDIHT